jgi:hypothetical protein
VPVNGGPGCGACPNKTTTTMISTSTVTQQARFTVTSLL